MTAGVPVESSTSLATSMQGRTNKGFPFLRLVKLGLVLFAFLPSRATILASDAEAQAEAAVVANVSWEPSDDSGIVGYRIHFGLTPNLLKFSETTGSVTSAVVRLPFPGLTYFFTVTAFNDQGAESEFSDIVPFRARGVFKPSSVSHFNDTIFEDTDLALPPTLQLLGDSYGLSWVVLREPQYGRIDPTRTPPIYQPLADYFGQDSFEILSGLGSDAPESLVWDFEIKSVNDAPVAASVPVVHAFAGQRVGIPLVASDADRDALTYAIVSEPRWGAVIIRDGVALYDSPAEFEGHDSLAFRVFDGQAWSRTIRVNIQVAAPEPIRLEMEVVPLTPIIQLRWNAIPGRRYVLDSSTELGQTNWTMLTELTAQSTNLVWLTLRRSDRSAVCYRVTLLEEP